VYTVVLTFCLYTYSQYQSELSYSYTVTILLQVIEDMDEFVKLLSPNLAIVNQLFTDLGRPDVVSPEATEESED